MAAVIARLAVIKSMACALIAVHRFTYSMTAYLLTLHLLHLALPAAVLALCMVALAGWMPGWRGRRPWVTSWRARWGLTFALNLTVSLAGLVWLGADGKMSTYGALVLASVLAQFVLWRGWRV